MALAGRRSRSSGVGRSAGSPVGHTGLLVGVVGQVVEDLGHGFERRGGRLAKGGHPGAAGVDPLAAQLVRRQAKAGQLGHRAGPGHVGHGVGGHDHHVGHAQQQRRSGHGQAVGDDDDRDHPRTLGQRLGRPPPAVQRRHPSDVGARRGQHHDQRDALAQGGAGGGGDRLAVGGAQRAPPALVDVTSTTLRSVTGRRVTTAAVAPGTPARRASEVSLVSERRLTGTPSAPIELGLRPGDHQAQ